MRLLVSITLAIVAVLIVLNLVGSASAQEAAGTGSVVSFDPFIAALMPYLEAIALAVITAAFGWVARKVHEWTGITVEAKHREAFQSATLNGARAIAAKYGPTNVQIDVKSVPLKEGVEFVLRSVPDAVKYFKLEPEDIARHLEPKLVAITGGTPDAK